MCINDFLGVVVAVFSLASPLPFIPFYRLAKEWEATRKKWNKIDIKSNLKGKKLIVSNVKQQNIAYSCAFVILFF